MKKPVLLFALKCAAIIYFAASANIKPWTSSNAVSELVTKGSWKVNCYDNANIDNTCIFEGYTFSFDASGKVVACKNGQQIAGNWIEDNISKKITLNFSNSRSVLAELNNQWSIENISDKGITFNNTTNQDIEKLYITAL